MRSSRRQFITTTVPALVGLAVSCEQPRPLTLGEKNVKSALEQLLNSSDEYIPSVIFQVKSISNLGEGRGYTTTISCTCSGQVHSADFILPPKADLRGKEVPKIYQTMMKKCYPRNEMTRPPKQTPVNNLNSNDV